MAVEKLGIFFCNYPAEYDGLHDSLNKYLVLVL